MTEWYSYPSGNLFDFHWDLSFFFKKKKTISTGISISRPLEIALEIHLHVQQGSKATSIVLLADAGLDKFDLSHPNIKVGNFVLVHPIKHAKSGYAIPKWTFDWETTGNIVFCSL